MRSGVHMSLLLHHHIITAAGTHAAAALTHAWNLTDMTGHKRTRGDVTAPLREWFAIRCAWIVECLPAIRQSFLHRVHRSEAEMAHVNLQNASVREHTEPKSVQNNDRH